MLGSINFAERVDDVIFFIALNFWYVFLIVAILFILLSIKLFRDNAILKFRFRNQNRAFKKLATLRKIGDVEAFLSEYQRYIGADNIAIYLRRGDIYVLEAQGKDESEEIESRVYKKDIKKQSKKEEYTVYSFESCDEKALLRIYSKKELAIEEIEGFLMMLLSYYLRINELHKEIHLSTIMDSSKNILTNVMSFQYRTQTFLKFVGSLLLKTTNATGMILKNRENPTKVDVFKYPKRHKFKKAFYIRNTPYILEVYTNAPLDTKQIAEIGAFLDLAGGYFENMDASSKMVANYLNFLLLANRALELQSPYFKDHARKVELVSVEIAKNIFLDERHIDVLRIGARLHDIGMIGKIENFLDSKKIEKKELDLIRYHPIVGSVLVEPINNVYPIAPIIKYHHERYDGGGYPYGLKGKDIPLLAQIVALAEFYIGLTSPRAYRKPFSHQEAVEKIAKEKNRLVEASIIQAFLDSAEKIYKKLQIMEAK